MAAGLIAAAAGWADTDRTAASVPTVAVISPDLPNEAPARDDLDAYGGWKGLKGKATGFFHVEELGGRTWFITPAGNVFFMLNMGWAGRQDAARLQSWGFNSSEPDTGLPYTKEMQAIRQGTDLPLPKQGGYPPWTTFPDVFDPAWEIHCKEEVERNLAPRAQDPLMIGYYLDNELGLYGWYEAVMHTAKNAPARAAFVEVARAYYAGKPADIEKDWKKYGVTKVEDLMSVEGDAPDVPDLAAAWESAVAEKAFSTVSKAAKTAAPNHLNLGMRLVNGPLPGAPILAAMGKYCDVISLNTYNLLPDRLLTQLFTMFPAVSMITGKPTLVSEFSFRGGDTALPNTVGAWPTVKTQAERAVGYLSYVAAVASLPTHIGVAWYKYPDDKPIKDWHQYGEDCNFGVVDAENRPYAVLTQGMRSVNAVIYDLAADPAPSATCPLFYRTELTRWDQPADAVLFQRLMRVDEPFNDPLAAVLPEPRRYHPNYWICHRGPRLVINDDRFSGWCQANMIRQTDNGTELTLFNVQTLTTFPRSLWLGAKCRKPDDALIMESNAQFLARTIDGEGRVTRLTMSDGTFIRTDYDTYELRCDVKVPYLDVAFRPDAKELTIVTRGPVSHVDIVGVNGWKAAWNGTAVPDAQIGANGDLTGFTAAQ